ncbi:DoxX family protein [Actinoplanes sp. NPDC051513]|uniref:DoxX family protein n=1 Tax=Actinoplanes sp. NPDC051513 TaxID=3363908 RepID=UPI0037A85E64
MFTAYVVVAVLTAAANIWISVYDFVRADWVLANMSSLGIPHSWLLPLGALKTAGALGLLAGIGVPLIGLAAATGLTLFFVGAMISHARARARAAPRTYAYPGMFLLLAIGSLSLRLASW